MSVDSKKTILLEKKYLYVRASLGFQLEGTSTEVIPTNNGFYRFYVDNLSKALGNSYVNILYDSKDLAFQSFCSDLYMDELMSSDSSAIEDVVIELQNNTKIIEEFESGVSSAMASNHEDNVLVHSDLSLANQYLNFISKGIKPINPQNDFFFSELNLLSGLFFPKPNNFVYLDIDEFDFLYAKVSGSFSYSNGAFVKEFNLSYGDTRVNFGSKYKIIFDVFPSADSKGFQFNFEGGNLVSKRGSGLNSNKSIFENSLGGYNNFVNLIHNLYLVFTPSEANKLIFCCPTKKYSRFEYFIDNSLNMYFRPALPGLSCSLYQNLNIDMDTSSLNTVDVYLYLYTPLSLDNLNFSIGLYRDDGYNEFPFSSIEKTYSSSLKRYKLHLTINNSLSHVDKMHFNRICIV